MFNIPAPRYVLPNLVTLSGAACGFASIWESTHATVAGDYYRAAALIILAAFLDGFDGRVARLVKGESKFGMQFDSLSDFLCFGVAPGMLVYSWALEPLGMLGFAVSFGYAACAMMRLARFNVQAEEAGSIPRFFVGMPSPMAGVSVALLVGLNVGVFGREQLSAAAVPSLAAVVGTLGALMISNVPFRTYKDARKSWVNRAFMFSVLLGIVVVSVRWDMMIALALAVIGYLAIQVPSGLRGVSKVARRRTRR